MSTSPTTVDLRPGHWAIVRNALRQHVPDREVLVFGSRATWTAKEYSDLDLAIMGDEPLSLRVVSALDEALGESDLPFKVDIVEWTRIDEGFRRIIRGHGVVVRGVGGVDRATGSGHRSSLADSSLGGSNSGWNRIPLGDFVTLQRGHDLPAAVRRPGNTPILGSFGVTGWHDESRAAGPGVTVGRSGASFGVVSYSSVDYWPLNTALYVTDFHGNDQRFAYYFLRHFDFRSYNSGSAQPSLNRNFIHPVPVDVPPLPEQRAIAHILGTLDDKIELNRRMNETLDVMARALFKFWFVDFDPVRAKMDGRDTGLPQDIADLFPDRLVDSEMGEIPVGWEVSEIGKEVKAVGGSTPSTKEPSYWHRGQHYWATPKDLSKLWSPVLLETSRKITDAGLQKISSGTLPVGTVLLSSRAPIGYLAIAEIPTAVNQGFIAMRCEQRLPNLYVLYWCYHNLGYIRDIAGGSTFAEISKRAFRPISVLVPSEATLGMYERLSHTLYDRLVVNMKEALILAALRDSLLPKLISGETRVADAEQALESVT